GGGSELPPRRAPPARTRRGAPPSPRRPGDAERSELKRAFCSSAQRVVEFRERGLDGLHRGKRGLESLLHRLDPAGGRQRLVGRAAGLKPFRCLDGRILQFIESRPLLGRGLYRLGDAIDRQGGDARRPRIAELGESATAYCGGRFIPWRYGGEA